MGLGKCVKFDFSTLARDQAFTARGVASRECNTRWSEDTIGASGAGWEKGKEGV